MIAKDLGRRGIAFFHGRFIYPNSPCKIVLPTLDGENMTMEGKITRCQHLLGVIHEVGAAFQTPVDLTLFTKMTPEEIEVHIEEYARDVSTGEVNSKPIERGHVLLIDPCKLDRSLYRTFLGQIGLSCHESADLSEAMGLLADHPADAAVIDVCRDPVYGFDLITELRQSGFDSPILAVSTEDDDQTQSQATEAGATSFLPKPFDRDALYQCLDTLMGLGITDTEPEDPIISTYSEDETMRPLIREFVNYAR